MQSALAGSALATLADTDALGLAGIVPTSSVNAASTDHCQTARRLGATKIGQISRMLRSYFYSSSIPGTPTPQGHDGSYFCSSPRDSDSPGPRWKLFLFFPSTPRDSGSPHLSRCELPIGRSTHPMQIDVVIRTSATRNFSMTIYTVLFRGLCFYISLIFRTTEWSLICS
jgi:hypothetical protein